MTKSNLEYEANIFAASFPCRFLYYSIFFPVCTAPERNLRRKFFRILSGIRKETAERRRGSPFIRIYYSNMDMKSSSAPFIFDSIFA